LLSLVAPELSSLINCWLAALRDSALLSLPPEFKSQLPPKGGAYYTAECADNVPEDKKRDTHFHVMLGICIETLCSNRTTSEDTLTVQLCLRSLKNLLACNWSRLLLMRNVRLPIEVVNVLYRFELICYSCNKSTIPIGAQAVNLSRRLAVTSIRFELICYSCNKCTIPIGAQAVNLSRRLAVTSIRLILTRDNLRTQQLCADVVITVLDAAQYSIAIHRTEKDIENGNSEDRGSYRGAEGTADGLQPASSLAFAVLEVALCLLVRQANEDLQIPQINTALMRSKSAAPFHYRRYSRLPVESNDLIKMGLVILTRIPMLCCPDGVIVVLPSILYLVLGVLHESSLLDKALRSLLSKAPSDETFPKWVSVMKSALVSLLNMAEDGKTDSAVMMLAVAVFVTSSPRQVVVGSSGLFTRICKMFHTCMENEHKQVVAKCLQSVASIFGRREVCYPFIRELVPKILNRIRPLVAVLPSGTSAVSKSDEDVIIIQEAMRALEMALSVAEPKKRLAIVNLIVQLLGAFLCEEAATHYRHLSAPARRLHDYALHRLNAIGPTHPKEFKRVLHSFPALKLKIEASIRHQSGRVVAAQQAQRASTARKCEQLPAPVPKPAAIKLKVDFSTFGSN
uniref:DUF4042 domain-containing protein n=1 Tax=Gongylonema pulchrum TaxID=637853 RepID=A0A183DZY7_9BILA